MSVISNCAEYAAKRGESALVRSAYPNPGTMHSMFSSKRTHTWGDLSIMLPQIYELINGLHEKGLLIADMDPSLLGYDHSSKKVFLLSTENLRRPGEKASPSAFSSIKSQNIGSTKEEDLWSLGCFLLYCVTGQTLRESEAGETDRSLKEKVDILYRTSAYRASVLDPKGTYKATILALLKTSPEMRVSPGEIHTAETFLLPTPSPIYSEAASGGGKFPM